ncbi:MAG: hypothetical protein AAGD86_14155, partial [Pseudomonadota bacterium]
MSEAYRVESLGRQDYEPLWRRMQAYTDERGPGATDLLWFCEHPPVFTLGMAASREHVLAPGDIPLVQIDRGGQVTYHGPGQLMIYPLLDVRRAGLGVRALVRYDPGVIDSLSLIRLDEHLGRLTVRDLRQIETKVPTETLKQVIDLAVEIGREGREGKPVGTLLVVGDHRKTIDFCKPMGFDPVKGYTAAE